VAGCIHRLGNSGLGGNRCHRFPPECVKAEAGPVQPELLCDLPKEVAIDVAIFATNAARRFYAEDEFVLVTVTRPKVF
jgi:hypothetical protein